MTSTRTFKTTSEVEASAAKDQKPKKIRSQVHLKLNRKFLPWFIVLIFLLISIFLYTQYLTAKHKLNPSEATVSKQVNNTISEVSKLAVVPSNQTPTVATVENVSKLRSQSFFTQAENGDKVVVYAKQNEAILYRPSTNQIVNIAPVTVK
jgi:hypothetical protein